MNDLILGLVIFLLENTLCYQTGLLMNPEQDFGPRLVALFEGYGTETFSAGWWAYGPFGECISGSIAGRTLYDALVFTGGESPVNYRWPHPGEV